ncbi:hypothetical protein [Sporisorium scitamineum]|uniref:Uncharacterized protein n=1 Tax=Sporisorium scitamineum TaxID=49012 RepID=A0A0F7RVE4_9BASI|nr:hypothetical protein [Sporisorium scitamineum]
MPLPRRFKKPKLTRSTYLDTETPLERALQRIGSKFSFVGNHTAHTLRHGISSVGQSIRRLQFRFSNTRVDVIPIPTMAWPAPPAVPGYPSDGDLDLGLFRGFELVHGMRVDGSQQQEVATSEQREQDNVGVRQALNHGRRKAVVLQPVQLYQPYAQFPSPAKVAEDFDHGGRNDCAGHAQRDLNLPLADFRTPTRMLRIEEPDDSNESGRHNVPGFCVPIEEFCTPACLLSLKHGLNMDPLCPNADMHCATAGCTDHSQHTHMIDVESVLQSIQSQLRYGFNMEPVAGKEGLHAQLLRIVDPSLGYAFAAKGENYGDGRDLVHEDEVYRHIWRSAECFHHGFPVLNHGEGELGQVRMLVPLSFGVLFRYDQNDDWLYMSRNPSYLLMSYHGDSLKCEAAQQKLHAVLPEALRGNIDKVLRLCDNAMFKAGIDHGDVHEGNLTWCESLESIVVLDVERTAIFDPVTKVDIIRGKSFPYSKLLKYEPKTKERYFVERGLVYGGMMDDLPEATEE